MNFYDKCLCKLRDFAFNGLNLEKEEINECLRSVLGHEPCKLLCNPGQSVSITDIRTDLKYVFERIKLMEKK